MEQVYHLFSSGLQFAYSPKGRTLQTNTIRKTSHISTELEMCHPDIRLRHKIIVHVTNKPACPVSCICSSHLCVLETPTVTHLILGFGVSWSCQLKQWMFWIEYYWFYPAALELFIFGPLDFNNSLKEYFLRCIALFDVKTCWFASDRWGLLWRRWRGWSRCIKGPSLPNRSPGDALG